MAAVATHRHASAGRTRECLPPPPAAAPRCPLLLMYCAPLPPRGGMGRITDQRAMHVRIR